MSQQWYTKKWVNISLHVLCWALFFAFPFLLRPVMDHDVSKHYNIFPNGLYYLFLANNILRVALFYCNAFVFIPQLVYKRKLFAYALVLVGAIAVLLMFDRLFFRLFLGNSTYIVWNFFVFNLPVFVFIVITSAAFRLIRDRIEENQRNKERETENLKTELSFLRSQVSPHFMFNVINNIVALARKKSDLVEPSLIRLSSLMRYFLYESNAEKVPLEKEVEYLESYIALQQQRFGKGLSIHFKATGINGYEIEPMLLIPFVENAFKHGSLQKGSIDICLDVKDSLLHFTVINPYHENVNEIKDATSGIGLANVSRRLNLLYNKRHNLSISQKDGQFLVLLELKLH